MYSITDKNAMKHFKLNVYTVATVICYYLCIMVCSHHCESFI